MNAEEQKKLIRVVIDELKDRLSSCEGPERGDTLLTFDLGKYTIDEWDYLDGEFWDRIYEYLIKKLVKE
jgi:hypothetical protein